MAFLLCVQEVVEKKGEIEKAFALDERLSGRLDDSGEGTLGKYLTPASLVANATLFDFLFHRLVLGRVGTFYIQ
jgi:hypothetical protein